MKNRFYLDYNATSPFSTSFKSYLEKGDFPFANPASIHTSGKFSRKCLNQVEDFLFNLFDLAASEYHLVFHSGATEGIRSFFEAAQEGDAMFYCESDHPATISSAKALKERGVETIPMSISSSGDFELEHNIELIKSWKTKNKGRAFANFLYVHNETGVRWSLEDALSLKEKADCYVHVDSTQSPGKIINWDRLSTGLDAYTYSAHKFGAMKGIGFSFVRKAFPFKPLMKGGAQQSGLRGGTENVLGAISIKLALEDIQGLDLSAIEVLRNKLEQLVLNREDAIVVGKDSKYGRAVNTLNFIIKSKKADISLIQFDMAGLDISSGSACSAGSVEPSNTLISMGLRDYAKNGLRVSLGQCNIGHEKEILKKFEQVIKRL